MPRKTRLLLVLPFLLSSPIQAKVVEYELAITLEPIHITKTKAGVIKIGGQFPGPTLEAEVGDTFRVTFHNRLNEPTSIHWHGILLPNEQDGVPYLTTPPIMPNQSWTYEFPIIHSGTYWYHAHFGLQEQQGLFGTLVFHPKNKAHQYREEVIAFSDWTNEHPHQVLANLKKDGDYYALKKDSVQSWNRVLAHGWQAVKNRLHSSLTRMGPMDISDVGYDAFLVNGRPAYALEGKPGETIRLRMVNAAASSYFYVQFAGGPMQVIAADGVDVEPFMADKLKIAIAETYDVLVTLPEHKAYELRASSEDGTGFSSVWIGEGQKIQAPTIPKPNPYVMQHRMNMNMNMNMSGHGSHMGHEDDYGKLRSPHSTVIKSGPLREIPLELTGNMESYIWSFDNKTLSEADKILIKKGEKVRMIFTNETMMHHPLHLHGHFFRVLNGQGDYSPLKHTVNVPPMSKVVIEFEANAEKDWFFHCHNLYHMHSGMTRIISYGNDPKPSPTLLKNLDHNDPWFYKGEIGVLSNMTAGGADVSNVHTIFEIEYDYNYNREYEIDLTYQRRITRFLRAYAGLDVEKSDPHEHAETTGIFGVRYVLPLLIDLDLRVDTDKHVRLELGSMLQLTPRLGFDWFWNTDDEYRLSLRYTIMKSLNLITTYDSDYHWGAGAVLKF